MVFVNHAYMMHLAERTKTALCLNKSVFNHLLQSLDGLALLVNLVNYEAKQNRKLYRYKDPFLGFLVKHHSKRWISFDEYNQEVLYIEVQLGNEHWVLSFHSGRWAKKYPELIIDNYAYRENNSQLLAKELIAVYIGL